MSVLLDVAVAAITLVLLIMSVRSYCWGREPEAKNQSDKK